MGIDIYCGTMTRYYSGDWDSEGKRYCLENGLEYKVIRPNSDEADDDEALSSEEIEELVLAWRASIIKDASKLRGKSFSPWQENRDMPYLTNRFDMGAFGAFFIAYSSIYYEKKYPKAIDITKSFYEYPIVKKHLKNQNLFY